MTTRFFVFAMLVAPAACASFASRAPKRKRSKQDRGTKQGFSTPPIKAKSSGSCYETWVQKVTAENEAQCLRSQSHFATATEVMDDERMGSQWVSRAIGGSHMLHSRQPIFTEDACADLVHSIETHAAGNGWGSRYSHQSRSLECHMEDLPDHARALFDNALSSTLLPAAAHQLDVPTATMRVYNALAVKYDASLGLDSMEVHTDVRHARY